MNKVIAIALLTLSLSIKAYNIEQNYPITPQELTYSAPDSLNDAAIYALNTWNSALDGRFSIKRVYDNSAYIQYVLVEGLGDISGREVLGDTANYTTYQEIEIVQGNGIWSTVLHETGHALGLAHTTDPHAIMQAIMQNIIYLDQDDVDGIREIYGYSPKVLDFNFNGKNKFSTTNNKLGLWYFDDGRSVWSKKFTKNLKKGIHVVYMVQNNLACYKTIQIR